MGFIKNHTSRIVACVLLVTTLLLTPILIGRPQPYLPEQPLPVAPFIDMHCHTAGLGAGGSGCFVSDQMRHSFKLRFYLKSFGVTEEEILREGDAIVLTRLSERLAGSAHVGRAVVLALDGVVEPTANWIAPRPRSTCPTNFSPPK